VGAARLILRQVPAGTSTQELLANPSTPIALGDDLRLQSLGNCAISSPCLGVGTAEFADTGSDLYVSWGRWVGGSVSTGNSSLPLGQNRSVHYLVGSPTVSMPTSGTFSYSLMGATRPTISDGSVAPGEFRANAVVHFAPAMATRVGLEAQVTMPDGQYKFSTPGGLGNPDRGGFAMDGTNTFSGTLQTQPNAGGKNGLACGSAGCGVDVQGGFFGPEASRLGLGYSIVEPGSTGRTISGVGVLEKK